MSRGREGDATPSHGLERRVRRHPEFRRRKGHEDEDEEARRETLFLQNLAFLSLLFLFLSLSLSLSPSSIVVLLFSEFRLHSIPRLLPSLVLGSRPPLLHESQEIESKSFLATERDVLTHSPLLQRASCC